MEAPSGRHPNRRQKKHVTQAATGRHKSHGKKQTNASVKINFNVRRPWKCAFTTDFQGRLFFSKT